MSIVLRVFATVILCFLIFWIFFLFILTFFNIMISVRNNLFKLLSIEFYNKCTINIIMFKPILYSIHYKLLCINYEFIDINIDFM